MTKRKTDKGRRSTAVAASTAAATSDPASASGSKKSKPLSWDESYELLLQHAKANPGWDGNIRERFTTDGGYGLGRWARTQRHAHKNGKLDAEKVKKLQASGISMAVIDTGAPKLSWEDSYLLLDQHAKNNPNWDGIIRERFKTGTGYGLGRWARAQREAFKAGKLDDDKIKKLEKVGLKFSAVTNTTTNSTTTNTTTPTTTTTTNSTNTSPDTNDTATENTTATAV